VMLFRPHQWVSLNIGIMFLKMKVVPTGHLSHVGGQSDG